MDNEKETLVVTGLSGMVGSKFRELYQDKYRFVNMDLSEGVDITRKDQVEQMVGESEAATVIHLAAFTNVSAAHDQAGDKSGVCYRVNVIGTEMIAQACKKFGKYLVHISTDYVFDGSKETAYTETDSPHAIEWYGQTKLWAEEKIGEIGPERVILRLAFPYSANPSRPDFVAKIMERLRDDTLPPAFADHTLTPTLTDDVAWVLDYCVRNQPKGLYHCVGSSSHTDYEIAQMIKAQFDLPGTVRKGSLNEYLKDNPRPYQQTMKVSNQKLIDTFGIRMKTFAEGLATYPNSKD